MEEKKPKGVIFEDSKNLRFVLRHFLTTQGVDVVAEAGTWEEADGLLERIENGELDIDVATVDGNLSPGIEDPTECKEGREITRRLHTVGGIGVIGFSGTGVIPEADKSVEKGHKDDLVNLQKAVAELTASPPPVE
jgi:CheY-like chemotaxis protein